MIGKARSDRNMLRAFLALQWDRRTILSKITNGLSKIANMYRGISLLLLG